MWGNGDGPSLAGGSRWPSALLRASLQGEQEKRRLQLPEGLQAKQTEGSKGRKQEGVWAGVCPAPTLVVPALGL